MYENDISDIQQDDEELEDIHDFQQVGEYLMECEQEENLDETCHNEEDSLTEQELLTPRIESLAWKELTNPTPAVVAQATSAESCQLKTTLAKSVSKVLGETKEVKTLDSMRIKLKSNLTRKEDYEAALAIVQTKVLAKHSVVKQQFKKWEQNFFLEHECTEPSPEDIRNDRQGHDFYKTLRLCEQLLQHWNITVHT